MAQGGQLLRQPGAGHGLAQVNAGWSSSLISDNASPSQHAHRLTERKTMGSGAALDGLKLLKRAIQSFMIYLHPLAADEGQSVGMSQELLDLGLREAFAPSVTSI